MRTLYVSQQGCYVSLRQESLLIKQGETLLEEVQLPLLEQVLIFGKSQVTTQAIRACLWREIPIVYMSRLGWCYGRVLPVARGYRQLGRYQQELAFGERMMAAQAMVLAKLKNSRVMLQRQQWQRGSERIRVAIVDSLVLYLVNRGVVKLSDFEERNGGWFLNESGRRKYLQAWLGRMEEMLQTEEGMQPRWDLLMEQVKAFKRFVYSPGLGYGPYLIR